jgi:hypothetical protein
MVAQIINPEIQRVHRQTPWIDDNDVGDEREMQVSKP